MDLAKGYGGGSAVVQALVSPLSNPSLKMLSTAWHSTTARMTKSPLTPKLQLFFHSLGGMAKMPFLPAWQLSVSVTTLGPSAGGASKN